MTPNDPIDTGQPFYVGDWLIEPNLNRISRHGESHQAEPKLIEVLTYLARNRNRVVSKGELITEVWDDAYITENVISRAISKLRKLLSDEAEDPHIIETIRKQGYRLIAPVKPQEDTPEPVNLREQLRRMVSNNLALTLLLTGIFIGGVAWFLAGSLLAPNPVPVVIPVTSYEGMELDPQISPDGTRVAFAWTGPNQDNWDIYVKLYNSEQSLRLTRHPARERSPVWSPDGTRVAFIRYVDGRCTIFEIAALGGNAKKLVPCPNNTLPDLAWAPDGEWLAIGDREHTQDPHSIYLISPETLEKRKLTSPPTDYWGDLNPEFSPDGDKIAFTRYIGEGLQDLYVVALATGNETRLTYDNMNMSGYIWTENGNNIIFASNTGGGNRLWSIPADGGTPRRLPGIENEITMPSVSRDRSRMAYLEQRKDINIRRVVVSNGMDSSNRAEKLIASTRWDMHPQLSPDGSRLAFTSNRSGSYEIWTGNLDGIEFTKLTEFGESLTGTPRWSPGGEWILFDSRTGGQSDLYKIDSDGGSPVRLTDTPHQELAASWSSDGRSVYFSSNESGSWEIWKMPADGGDRTRVSYDGGMGGFEHENGRHFYHSKKREPGIWRLDLQSGEETLVVTDLMPNDWASWELTGDGIYYVSRGPTSISFYNFQTDSSRVIYRPDQQIPAMDDALSVSPDGRVILFGAADIQAFDIMLMDQIDRYLR